VAHRWLLVVLTAWIVLMVCMGFVATGNFAVVEPDALRDADRIYAALEAGDERRMALRYVASELNRAYFQRYDTASLVLALAALGLRLRVGGHRASLIALLLCAGLVVLNVAYFTPTILELGRQIDFMPRDPPPPEVAEFFRLHGVNITLGLAQLVLLAGLLVVGVVKGPPGGRSTPGSGAP